MLNSVVFEEQVAVPLNLRCLEDFRRWALGDAFPERGRIDYVEGRIEVNMSPEDLFRHGALKVELLRVLSQLVKERDLGYLGTDRTRLSCLGAELSAEPDIVLLTEDTLASGRATLVPKAGGREQFIEIEGAADLVVEIVSDSSVTKDTQRLPEAYFRAGVREFWLADARGQELDFQIRPRGSEAFEIVGPDAEGFQYSQVLALGFRLERKAKARGRWTYDLRTKP